MKMKNFTVREIQQLMYESKQCFPHVKIGAIENTSQFL